MISIYKIKPKFQQLLMPLLKLLRRLGISPNSITLFSILLSFGIAYFFWNTSDNSSYFLIVAFGLLLRMMLNALDGMMPRLSPPHPPPPQPPTPPPPTPPSPN